jgi:hypothetical protein
MSRKHLYIFLFAVCILVSCERLSDPNPNYTYSVPDSRQSEFVVSSLEAEEMDEALITQMTNLIVREEYKRIDGLFDSQK